MKRLRPHEKRRAATVTALCTIIFIFCVKCSDVKTEPVTEKARLANNVIVFNTSDDVADTDDNGFGDIAIPAFGRISSPFGFRSNPFDGSTELHSGIDIAVSDGTAIHAFAEGTVSAAAWSEIGGYYIKIEHPNGFTSYYGHLSEILVSVGDEVSAGECVALSGSTGKVTGPHLHFQLSYDGRAVNPALYADFTP